MKKLLCLFFLMFDNYKNAAAQIWQEYSVERWEVEVSFSDAKSFIEEIIDYYISSRFTSEQWNKVLTPHIERGDFWARETSRAVTDRWRVYLIKRDYFPGTGQDSAYDFPVGDYARSKMFNTNLKVAPINADAASITGLTKSA